MLHCEGPGLPLAGVHMMSTHKMIRILYDTRLQRADKLSELALPLRRSFEVNIRYRCDFISVSINFVPTV